MNRLAIKGNLIYTDEQRSLIVKPGHYLLIEGDKIAGPAAALPDEFAAATVLDYGDCLVIPGLIDLHVHAAQYGYRGLGMDMELLPWLDTYAFPAESRFARSADAVELYREFAQDLASTATTRAIVWGTVFPTTGILFAEMNRCGLGGWIGQISMDRHAPSALCQEPAQAIAAARNFVSQYSDRFPQLRPVITPRFIPSCSDGLLHQLGALSMSQHVPVTSHLSENHGEIAWVRELLPQSQSYARAYDQFELLGQHEPCVMAHCVYPEDSEIDLLARRQVTIAHCPTSNINVLSGLAPVRRLIAAGVAVGLGTDIAGGHSLSIFAAMVDAIAVAKMYQLYVDAAARPLTVSEAFYLGTRGGGQVFRQSFGLAGSFESGWLADIAVIDDSTIGGGCDFSLPQRLERLVYLHAEATLAAKFLAGQPVGTASGTGRL